MRADAKPKCNRKGREGRERKTESSLLRLSACVQASPYSLPCLLIGKVLKSHKEPEHGTNGSKSFCRNRIPRSGCCSVFRFRSGTLNLRKQSIKHGNRHSLKAKLLATMHGRGLQTDFCGPCKARGGTGQAHFKRVRPPSIQLSKNELAHPPERSVVDYSNSSIGVKRNLRDIWGLKLSAPGRYCPAPG